MNGDFDPGSFYTIHNALRPNTTVSSGLFRDANGELNTTEAHIFSSSENWQIYYQQGRYFLRNYDYADWQLGVTEESRSVPRLMERSGALGQQWSLMPIEGGGGWRISNGLLGNGTWFSLNNRNTVPAMQASTNGAEWDIRINPSAGKPMGSSLYKDVEDFEVAPSQSPSPTPTTNASSTSSPPLLPPSSSTSASQPGQANPNSPSLSTGAIIGIAIGAFALVLFSALLAWFLIHRRRKMRQIAELPADSGPGSGPKTGRWAYEECEAVEIGSPPMVFEAQHKGMKDLRFEMG